MAGTPQQGTPQGRKLGPRPIGNAELRTEGPLDMHVIMREAAGTVLDQLKDWPPRNRLMHAGSPPEPVCAHDDTGTDEKNDGREYDATHGSETIATGRSYTGGTPRTRRAAVAGARNRGATR